MGVVQIRVTPKTRDPFTISALSVSGITWKWHFVNHAVTCNVDAGGEFGEVPAPVVVTVQDVMQE